ncbi:uncharacterized protein LOC131002331 isoform X2 [Salvia miltiorrhiza]|uniref:uncharacterized protein LOC131002331 isoform X2 n=1 Tax=Salvia miltiorrhiza TaxID=226208 RepID=UPI0025ACFC88|nr:uncharacterized protein LOC131002331 isoform X2 [Salvia miltiorrhiza]
MALLLSVSFSMPHCHRQTQFQASHSSRLTGGRLLNSLTSRTEARELNQDRRYQEISQTHTTTYSEQDTEPGSHSIKVLFISKHVSPLNLYKN